MIELPDLTLWEDRLRTQVPELAFVGGAAEVQGAIDRTIAVPSCFVAPSASDSLGENRFGTQITTQEIQHKIDVVLCVRNVRDVLGGAAVETLNAIRPSVLTALYGWTPESILSPLEYVAGQLISFDQYRLWWLDQFSTRQHFRG